MVLCTFTTILQSTSLREPLSLSNDIATATFFEESGKLKSFQVINGKAMVVTTQIELSTIAGKSAKRECMLDTGSRWTWISKKLADELGVKSSDVDRVARTADKRLVKGVLADEPIRVRLVGREIRLWITPCVAEWLVRDAIVGNDFMEKAGVRLIEQRIESYEPVGELY